MNTIKLNTVKLPEFKILSKKVNAPKFSKRPDCNDCSYLIKENGLNVCRLFKYSTVTLSDKKQFHYYMETYLCRSQQDLCGLHGEYFKPKN